MAFPFGTNSKLFDESPKLWSYQTEDLAAAGSIAARPLLAAPAGHRIVIHNVSIIPQAAFAGVDAANTCAITIGDGTNTLVAKTYNNVTTPPAAGAIDSLGAITEAYKAISGAEKLTLAIACGTTANPPVLMIQIMYSLVKGT